MSKRIRVWLDELMALPEYSRSLPTGTYPGKQWRTRSTSGWYIGMYGELYADDTIPIYWFEVVLMQGPRRGNERSRLNPDGRRPPGWITFPKHISSGGRAC